MSKKIINDIIVSKKSIRQIPISPEKEKKEGQVISRLRRKTNWQRKPLNPRFLIWFISALCLVALFFGVSMVFSSATIIISPRTQTISFNNESYILKNAETINDTTTPSFEVLKVDQNVGETVLANEEVDVTKKATGKIIIYNNYSTAPQRLINNTRFEAKNGKIYRINSSVVVPGYTKSSGKITPGSIEATVYADQSGEEYNLKLADLTGDFTIPGFKGDPRYTAFYARLKTDLAGGLVGKQRIVADELRKKTEEMLRIKLKEQLLKSLYAIKPENYLVFDNGYSVDYTILPDTPVETDKVKINLAGSLNAIVLNDLKLGAYLANKKITNFDNLPVEFIPQGDLVATFTGADSTGLYKNSSLQLKINGQAIIKWRYDGDAIRKDLLGKKEADLKTVLSSYQNTIQGLRVIFRPVWTRYFPDSLSKIKIEESQLD